LDELVVELLVGSRDWWKEQTLRAEAYPAQRLLGLGGERSETPDQGDAVRAGSVRCL
jgi:hypothetical protein